MGVCELMGVCGHAQDGWTALVIAAREGNTDCVRVLLESGANTEARKEVCD
jgi:ankyrin repeat protein